MNFSPKNFMDERLVYLHLMHENGGKVKRRSLCFWTPVIKLWELSLGVQRGSSNCGLINETNILLGFTGSIKSHLEKSPPPPASRVKH
ncbi:hypothetical protein BaRGS_00011790 [Batillaria attramentaria]|uniref:Uncharacterized protein n=1 Tax=Batillaria attramentaria TaxID=370345 RepID=A0ABD0LC07_9CAEN